jgi:gas vesicle protein
MRTNHELFYFVAGITVGVIAALLVAPYSGEETRQYLRDRVDEGRERAEDMLERGKDFVGSQRDSISNTVAYGRRNYQEKI